jgi:hypothetical protein
MTNNRLFTSIAAVTALLVAVIAVQSAAKADDEGNSSDPRIRRGFEIAPVPLSMEDKNRALVGLGSYIVNAVADCNGCHSNGPATQFEAGGNPFAKGNPPKVINQKTYLGGGRIFATPPGTPKIISRNLTPDKTGRAEGGRTFAEFRQTMRTGADLDQLHPNCSDTTILTSSSCFPAGQMLNGDLLQVMPWFAFQDMTDHDLRAIYEYLSAIPCIAGPPAPSVLHNECF